VRFQWGRDFEFQTSQPPLTGQPVSSAGTAPGVVISGTSGITFGKPNFLERRSFPDERRVDAADTITWSIGSHLLKLGGGVSRVSDKIDNLFEEGGVYNYSSRVDFITDFATRTSASPTRTYTSFNQGLGPTGFSFHTFDYDAYVQDTWHATPRTTLNLGLRWDYQKMPEPQIANPLLPASSVFPDDTDNFGPRLGLAHDLTGNGNSVIRGGYGIFYGRVINSSIYNAIANVGSASGQTQLLLQSTSAGAPSYPNILSGASATPVRPNVVVFQEDAQNPMVHEYDVIYEQRIADNTMVSVSYVGSRGKNLPLFVDTNLPAPSGTVSYTASGGPLDGQVVTVPLFTGARPNPNFSAITEISSLVESKYNAVVLQFNRRLQRGLQFHASYTEARATDNGQTSTTFTSTNNVVNPFDLGLEEGRSNFEVKHRFVANAIWSPTVGQEGSAMHTVLSGFTVAPAFTATSGSPQTGFVTGNTPNTARVSTGLLGSGGSNRIPSIERNTFFLPKTINLDLRVSRGFRLAGSHTLEAMVDVFNVFDRLNYTAMNTTMYTVGGTVAAPTLTANPTFGTLTNANSNYFVFTPRQVQIAARYTF
jgi:hypothetical protein